MNNTRIIIYNLLCVYQRCSEKSHSENPHEKSTIVYFLRLFCLYTNNTKIFYLWAL